MKKVRFGASGLGEVNLNVLFILFHAPVILFLWMIKTEPENFTRPGPFLKEGPLNEIRKEYYLTEFYKSQYKKTYF